MIAPVATPASAKHDADVAAKQLEAFFLRQLLTEARPAGGGAMDSGFAGDTFKSMLDEAIADKMAAAGGIGMSQMFTKQLSSSNTNAISAAPPPMGLEPHELAPHTPIAGAPIDLIMPVVGRPSSGYGMRHDAIQGAMSNHPGFDLAAKSGTPVAAAATGEITHAGPAGTYGNLVIVKHPSGFETRYAHLSAVTVKVGAHVTAGDQIGNVGTTGYSTGPHLHFEVRHDGKTMDPAPLLPLNRSESRPNR